MERDNQPSHQDRLRDASDHAPDPFAAVILKLGHAFAVLFLVSMLILIFEIFMRYVLNKPTVWVHETTIFLCAICFVFGGLHSVARNGHIRVVLIYDHVSAGMRRWLDVVIYSICGLATIMFSIAIWPTVVDSFWAPSGEFRMITSGSAWNPPLPTFLRTFLFVTLVAMTIQFALFVLYRLRGK